MAATNLQIKAIGVDMTAAMFNSIAGKAKGLGNVFGKAMKLIGVGAGMAGIVKTVKELGRLSDVAQQASATTDELTGMSTAMDILGVKGGSIDELAKSFNYMTKTTGQQGVEGFEKVINSIGRLGSAQERAEAAQKAFGRSGLQYLPLINAAAKEGGISLRQMAADMGGITQAGADAGDNIADAMTWATAQAKNAWFNFVGDVSAMINDGLEGGVYGATIRVVEYFKYACTHIGELWNHMILSMGNRMTANLTATWETVKAFWNGESLLDAFSIGSAKYDELVEEGKKAIGAFLPEEELKRINDKVARMVAARATNAAGKGIDGEGMLGGKKSGASLSTSNAWLAGGSYAAATAGLRAQMRREDEAAKSALRTANGVDKIVSMLDRINPNEVQTME